MTTIKIKDKEWFEENCVRIYDCNTYFVPRHWTKEQQDRTVSFLTDGPMGALMGQVLIVEEDDQDDVSAKNMMGSRYFVKYWIPNWAIEWVKEEFIEEEPEGIKCLTKEEALRVCDIIAWASKQSYLGRTEAGDLCGKIVYSNKGWL